MRIAMTGSSGLIGTALAPTLRADGHEVIRFVRGPQKAPDQRSWDPSTGLLDDAHLDGVDAVIHLAGAGVGDRRWTHDYRALIMSSRLGGTATLAAALARTSGDRPRILLSASAVGYYGDTGDAVRDETAPAGAGFLADVCVRWEAATAPAAEAGVRVALLRTGIVLSSAGGALGKQLPLFRSGLGAPLGSGRQWLPWVSLPDEVGAIRHCLTTDVAGPVNLVAPAPVTNRDFTRTLGRALHRPTLPVAVPGFVLRAALGDFAREGVLAGQRLRPAVLERTGYAFSHPALDEALSAVLA